MNELPMIKGFKVTFSDPLISDIVIVPKENRHWLTDYYREEFMERMRCKAKNLTPPHCLRKNEVCHLESREIS